MSNQQPKSQPRSQSVHSAQQKKPNERGSFDIQAHVKIFDPKTKKVYVEGRA